MSTNAASLEELRSWPPADGVPDGAFRAARRAAADLAEGLGGQDFAVMLSGHDDEHATIAVSVSAVPVEAAAAARDAQAVAPSDAGV